MYWVIQKDIFNEPFYNKLLAFLEKVDIPYETVKVVPFVGEFVPEPTPTQENVIVIGSYSMSKSAIRRGWIPGAFDNENYDYRVWSKEWEGYCLNAPACIYKFGEVPEQENDFFIRPCEDTKAFTGYVTDWKEFSEWQQKVCALSGDLTEKEKADIAEDVFHTLGYETMVLVSKPKDIVEEYRFVIVDGKVITGSMYKNGPVGLYNECTNSDIIEFAQKITDIWVPSRAFALDIAVLNGEYYVIEMGCVNSAGLYECDIQKIVMAIEDMKL